MLQRPRSSLTTFVLALLISLAGCGQNQPGGENSSFSSFLGGKDATIGTMVGGLGGGLLGSQVGSGAGKVVAIGAGAVIGAALGNYIGSQLDARDKEQAGQAVNKALDSPNQTVAWNNPQSGNSGTVIAKPIHYEHHHTHPVTLVPPPANPEQVAPVWVASSETRLRAGPSTQSAVIGHLRANRNFQVLGKEPDSNWLIVGKDGQHVGYVSGAVVKPVGAPSATDVASNAPSSAPASAPTPASAPPPTGQPAVPPGTLASVGTPSASGGSGGLIDPDAVDRDVGGGGGGEEEACRTTISTVTIKGQDQPQVNKSKFCRQPDGTWAPVST
jgi:surface antigen